MEKRLQRAANRLAGLLYSQASQKVVFAESCTAGMVAAELGSTPGISNYLCGSVVTYRESAKEVFLDVESKTLATHTAVSIQVTEQMAVNVLKKLAEASWSAAVTGHLGPSAPSELDGKVYVAIARRNHATQHPDVKLVDCVTFELSGEDRVSRQQEASSCVLESLYETMQQYGD